MRPFVAVKQCLEAIIHLRCRSGGRQLPWRSFGYPAFSSLEQDMSRLLKIFALTLGLLAVMEKSNASYLYPNSTLYANQRITSEQGKYSLVMQGDGHLVMYRADGSVRWSAGASGWYSIMQGDGNFVLYNSAYQPMFSTGTYGNPNALLHIQDDGNLVVYSSDWRPLWWIGGDPPPDDPQNEGDLVGRDLASTGGAPAGHIGIYDGQYVYDAIDDPENAVERITLSDYKSASHYWGSARPRVPAGYQLPDSQPNCYSAQCPDSPNPGGWSARRAMILRAYQISVIGARYTVFSVNTKRAMPGWYGGPPQLGVYRCDTFVIDTYTFSDWIGSASYWTLDQQRWDDLTDSLGSTFEVTPGTVFAKVKEFQ